MSANRTIDLRSDTVTRPTAEMRRAMAEAEVGDDVYGEDPTIRRLEERAAELLGVEASLFVPSGTMGNQIAIHLHADRGTEVLVDEGSHVYNYELAAMSAWTGAMPRVLRGERGIPSPAQVHAAIAPDVYYLAPARLLVLENTHNHAGGVVLGLAERDALIAAAREHGLAVHLDGARVFNASTALGGPVADVVRGFDSVMFCLSKGLGAPVGSMLCGSRAFVREARVARKRFGGGMRQAGVLAAAGLVALDRHVDRLHEDHDRARRLASAVAETPGFLLDPRVVETNIVIAEVEPGVRVEGVLEGLRLRGVLAGAMGPGRIRWVTHLDVDDDGLSFAIEQIRGGPRALSAEGGTAVA